MLNFDKIIKKKKKGYYFRIDVGQNPNTGKRKQQSFGPFKTKGIASKELIKVKNQIDEGSYFRESNDNFGDFVEKWFETSYTRSVEETTAESRRYLLNNHILTHFRHKSINEITTFDIDCFYADKLDEDYSPSYIRQMHNMLNKSFDQAVRWSLIKINPVMNANPPKIITKEKLTWSVEQVNLFRSLIINLNFEMAYILTIFTGMRRGEVLGLKWEDVDLTKGKISIKRSLSFVKGKGLIFKAPKTAKSKRQISISDYLISLLKKQKYKQERQIKKDSSYNENNLVVCSEIGKPVDPSNLLRQFSRLIKKAELPKISFHDLRHTHATILMQQGENPKVVSERLGHSRVGITLDLYSHVNDDLQERAAQKFEESLFKDKNNN
ncbi:site-specific integrase [Filobacillus milosensis]|uniref:Site-specific integrase n=1 Tax=Filobacillus milosensis TaxID=94137 RepID=A0A4Y8IGK2_9BACI|nr:site-specific integrase [Filobacillus milosensis]